MIESYNIGENYLKEIATSEHVFWNKMFLFQLFKNTENDDLSDLFPEKVNNLLIEKIKGSINDKEYIVTVIGQEAKRLTASQYQYKNLTSPRELKLTLKFSVSQTSSAICTYLKENSLSDDNFTPYHALAIKKQGIYFDFPKRKNSFELAIPLEIINLKPPAITKNNKRNLSDSNEYLKFAVCKNASKTLSNNPNDNAKNEFTPEDHQDSMLTETRNQLTI